VTADEGFPAEPDDNAAPAGARRSLIAGFIREPLVHFLLLGALVAALYGALNPDPWRSGGDGHITVSREKLLTFIQYRTKLFEPSMAKARLAALSPAELKRLVDDYIEEEALYREARALGLDEQDYIVKRRMVQKVEFIAGGMSEAKQDIPEERLRAFYRENSDRFASEGAYTFTHVFLADDGEPAKALKARATARLRELASKKATFEDAPRFSDRFPYGVNFVEVTAEQIDSQFGGAFTRQLAALEPARGKWQGPLTSGFGAHLVMLVTKSEPQVPRFEDVREEVAAALAQVIAEEETGSAVAQIVARYKVDMEFDDPRLASPRKPG